MYKTYVRPIREFGTTIAFPHYKKEIKKIEKVQITAVNIIYYRCLKHKFPTKPSYNEILVVLKSETLEIRRNILDLVLYHKIRFGLAKVDNDTYPLFRNESIRGTEGRPFIPYCRTNIRFNFFTLRVGRLYAKLPCDIVNDQNPTSFKSRLTKFDLSRLLEIS